MVLFPLSDRGRSRGDTPPDHKMSDQSDDEFDTGQGQAVSDDPTPALSENICAMIFLRFKRTLQKIYMTVTE